MADRIISRRTDSSIMSLVRKYNEFIYALAAVVLLLFLWFLVATTVTWLRDVPFPTPLSTFKRLAVLLNGEQLLEYSLYLHTFNSLLRWLIGFVIAATSGLMFGVVAGWWKPLALIAMPTVHVLQLIPGLAWIPVALLLFGVGEESTVFMIAMTAFAPVAINVVSGVRQIDETYIRAARMLGLNRYMLFSRVLLPGALPQILSGLRVGLGNGWRVLVAAEMIVGSGSGLGYAIIQSRWTLDFTSAFACLVIICLIGLAVERLIFLPLERRTIEVWGLQREQ